MLNVEAMLENVRGGASQEV